MALSTSFLDAMNLAASKQGKNGITANARVHAAAFLGHPEKGREGFGLSTSIVVENVEDDELILAAREVSKRLHCGVRDSLVPWAFSADGFAGRTFANYLDSCAPSRVP